MNRSKICLITGIPPTDILVKKLINVLKPLMSDMMVITGYISEHPTGEINNIKYVTIDIYKKRGLLLSIINTIIMQIKYSYCILANIKKYDYYIFFLGGSAFLIPILLTRLFNKKSIFIITHSTSQIVKKVYTNIVIYNIVSVFEQMNYKLCKKLVVYSPYIVSELKLGKYRNKIVLAYEHYVDLNRFKKQKEIKLRKYVLGYVGRLSQEKGIMNLLQAMLIMPPEVNLIICGDGELRDTIEMFIAEKNLINRVILTGWLPNEELPKYLNDIKMLIIPSYTEGLVNVMYEGMACGTIIIATPVGAIPEFVIDGRTGYLLQSNDPPEIARIITKARSSVELEDISQNAQVLVAEYFTLDKAVCRYQKVLDSFDA